MRLLNTRTLALEIFPSEDGRPKYAILSHTWGSDEIIYNDVKLGPENLLNSKEGLSKVIQSAKRAQVDGYDYIWIDTCCIDKSSSAELSEAINSMFRWYQDSAICYVFLADYGHPDPSVHKPDLGLGSQFAGSRWFTRGWTLQELIAPGVVRFFDPNWRFVGDRRDLAVEIAQITTIEVTVLAREFGTRKFGTWTVISAREILRACSTSRKMSWASQRRTTRVEDLAYCLLGIFDLNMPLLYGEGDRAFIRLQEQIARNFHDQTLLAWHNPSTWYVGDRSNIFAPSPSCFHKSGQFRPAQYVSEVSLMTLTGRGLELDVHLAPCTLHCSTEPKRRIRGQFAAGVLSCGDGADEFSCVGLLLERADTQDDSYIVIREIHGSIISPLRICSGVKKVDIFEGKSITGQYHCYVSSGHANL